MKEIKPLLYRPPILPEETLPSYLYRLASANLLSPNQLEALIVSHLKTQDNVKRLLRADSIDVLAKLTGLEPYKIFWASEHSLVTLLEDLDDQGLYETVTLDSGFSFPLLTLNATSAHLRWVSFSQFCPYCLREAAYQRRAWRVRKVAACIHHQCLLVDQCPNCQSYLLEQDIIKATCRNCLYPLAEAAAFDLSCDQEGLASQRLLYFWLNAGPQVRLHLPLVTPRLLYLLASQMIETTLKVRHGLEGLHPIPSINTPYTWREHGPSSKHAYVLWATAIKAMLDWPVNFHQFLEHRVNADISGYSSGTSIQKSKWLSGWLKQWPEEKNQLIHEGIASYLYDNFSWEDTQSRRDIHHALRVNKMTPSFPAFSSNFMWVRESNALRLLNVRSELVRQLIHAGLIRANAKTLNHKDPLIAREDVLKIYEQWVKGIPLDYAEPALHISKELAQYLVEAGILETVHSDEQNTSEYLLDKVALSNLLDSLYYKTSRRYLANASFYSLTEAVNILKPVGYDEPKLLQTALENRIPAILWRGNTLGDVLFQRKAIRELKDSEETTRVFA
ncbi:MAG: TniQ family protein [Anaerolineae bacterium]|nr:TniQ family protein [Anaerolineae bacterium]